MSCGRSSSVEWKLPKLQRRVRFPSPARSGWPGIRQASCAFTGTAVTVSDLPHTGAAFGNLGDRFGRKKLLLAGAAVFGASFVCGAFAPSPGFLIGARTFMGLGGATFLPSCLAVISELFPDAAQRARAIGIFAATFAAGFVIGPIIGRIMLDRFW